MFPPELLLLAQICIKSFVGCGFAPNPTQELTALSQDPYLVFGVGPSRKGKEGGEAGGRSEGERKGGEGKGKGEEGMSWEVGHPRHPQIFRWIDAFANRCRCASSREVHAQ